MAELYATTWGPHNAIYMYYQFHSCPYVLHLRKFAEAVLRYTNASQTDIISHSMGVTLARKIVQGGKLVDNTTPSCYIGPPLTTNVNTFIGIAGGNRGLTTCISVVDRPKISCNPLTGFFPGFCPSLNCRGNAPGLSRYLADLNIYGGTEGRHIYSIWSRGDDMLKSGDLVYGYPTSRIPGQRGEKVYDFLTHMQLRDNTTDIQFQMISGLYSVK